MCESKSVSLFLTDILDWGLFEIVKLAVYFWLPPRGWAQCFYSSAWKRWLWKKNFILFVHLFFNPRIINSNPSTGRLQIHNYFYLSDIVSPRLFMALNSFIAFRSLDTELTTFFELKFYCNRIDCPEKKKNESSCFVHHLFYPRSWKNIRNTRVNHLFVTVSHSSINITVDFQSEFFINKLIFSNQIRLSKKTSRKKIMIKKKNFCKISWKERIRFENRYSSHKTLGEFQ